MSYRGQLRHPNARDASSSSSVSIEDPVDHHNNSTASSASSTPALALPDDSDDPSFSSQRVATSTPRKTRRYSRRESQPAREEELDGLRLSDTESLDLLDDDAIKQGYEQQQQQQAKLTRRSLATHLEEGDFLQPYSTSLTPRAISVSHARFAPRGDLYAPSPSTGSSTLVDREDEGFGSSKARERDSTARHSVRAMEKTVEEEDTSGLDKEEEQRTEIHATSNAGLLDEDRASSSSPRAPRRSTVGDLAHYIDARLASPTTRSSTSTPRRSPPSRRNIRSTLPPQTPHAPGAFPSSARKLAESPTSPQRSVGTPIRPNLNQQKISPASSSAQIHDAFARLITGPKGALTNSAERRIAMQANATPAGPGSQRERAKVEAPDFAGRYSFSPSSSLPVEKTRRSAQRSNSNEDVPWTNQETGGHEVKIEQRRGEQEQRDREPRMDGHGQRTQLQALSGETTEDESVGDMRSSEEDEVRIAQRSAIDFAMAQSTDDDEAADASTEASPNEEGQPLRQPQSTGLRNSVRFAEPVSSHSRTPSDPQSSETPLLPVSQSAHSRSNDEHVERKRPVSPDLPALPPVLAPESPEPVRHLPASSSFRRSQPVAYRQSGLRQPVETTGSPPGTPIPTLSRSPARSSSPDRVNPPRSSTPPQRIIPLPNPDDTPPRASPSPLARRLRPVAQNPITSPSRSPPHSPPTESISELPLSKMEPVKEEEDDTPDQSIPLLLDQLSAAVRALTAARVSFGNVGQSLSTELQAEQADNSLVRALSERQKETARQRQIMEEELWQLEHLDQSETIKREDIRGQLVENYQVEQDLGSKVEELRQSIEDMGLLVGDQVARALSDSIDRENRKRKHWLAFAFCFQIGLFWIVLRLANARSSSLLHTAYYDPFQPEGLQLPLNPFSSPSDPIVSPDTIALFTPCLTSHNTWTGLETTAVLLRGTRDKIAQVASNLVQSRSTWSSRVVAPSSRSVPV
ncbi:uncharacterized protein JCM15063_002079 [Sporobolomyces koalae]|uniref:uncharacterized protein n=1 Tax=Sporobolomyces koalae TaxID=500713 RepID=UPI003174C13D